jgi:tetratricopeptide (TPR) repeat protein
VASAGVVEVLDGDLVAALEAVGDLEQISDDMTVPTAYRLVIGAHGGVRAAEDPIADEDRPAVLDVLFSLAGSLLALDRLDSFNLTVPLLYEVAPSAADVEERLGRLLFKEGFTEPAAERLIAAVEAGDPSPDAFGDLGRICQERDMPEDAEAFLVEARERDRQNISRYLDLAGLMAGQGRFADADAVLREGLVMHPYSSVLSELRESMSLLARA